MGATTAELLSAISSPCVDVKFDNVDKAIADARAFDKKVLCDMPQQCLSTSVRVDAFIPKMIWPLLAMYGKTSCLHENIYLQQTAPLTNISRFHRWHGRWPQRCARCKRTRQARLCARRAISTRLKTEGGSFAASFIQAVTSLNPTLRYEEGNAVVTTNVINRTLIPTPQQFARKSLLNLT
jgi:hypothetical protein